MSEEPKQQPPYGKFWEFVFLLLVIQTWCNTCIVKAQLQRIP